MSWPEAGIASAPTSRPGGLRARVAGIAGILLLAGGAATITVAVAAQQHAPKPPASAAGKIGRLAALSVRPSAPVWMRIPAIAVNTGLLHLGVNRDGTMQVPPLTTDAGLAAWYKYSVPPGQFGASVIEGHVDSYRGPAVFFRLGALRPGDAIDVKLADGVTAIFRVTGVREYHKAEFPASLIYAAPGYSALRLITCGGPFDSATGHYLDATVVFASLVAAHPS